MSHARARGAVLSGVDGIAVEVEVRISALLPRVDIVGLPEAAVRESVARVRCAVASAGQSFPQRRVTVNLAPAALRKGGAGLDLPIAVGVLGAAGLLEVERLAGLGLVGELALDGRLRPVRGALALALALRDAGCRRVVMAPENTAEAALAPGLEVQGARHLAALLAHLSRGAELEPARAVAPARASAAPPDLADVRGQERAKRVLAIAAGGGHGLLLSGPPGSGKTMLARRLPGLLPPLSVDEALEATRIHGAAGMLTHGETVVRERPFRTPHHSASRAGVLGGGSPARPGEVSLAHRGVLFLDELPEFERRVLESLREVMEERRVVLARAGGVHVFPADFQLIAAANPCPCGWRLSRWRDCRCTEQAVGRYAARLSGPLLDRIDLHLEVPAVPWRELESARDGPSSRDLRTRVVAARERQRCRLARFGLRTNAEIPDRLLDESVDATPEARALLGRAVERWRLTARGARRLLRVARTVADLADEKRVEPGALAEVLAYRPEAADATR